MIGPDAVTSWLLDRRTGWRGAAMDDVAVGVDIELAPDPDGPRGLTAAGSLGGLRLPPGAAVSRKGDVYLLRRTPPGVLRLDPIGRRFEPLPTIGGQDRDARDLRTPTTIAIADDVLFIVDAGSRRVLSFDLRSLTLIDVWGPRIAAGRPGLSQGPSTWHPLDIACHADRVYVLDGDRGHVYLSRAGRPPRRVRSLHLSPGTCSAIAVDRDGRLYLLEDGPPARLMVRAPDGTEIESVDSADAVRDRFDLPALHVDHQRRVRVPAAFARGDATTGEPAADATPMVFDLAGNPVEIDPYEPAGPRAYRRSGRWTSEPLDSGIDRCRWHRVELHLTALPEGAAVTVRTYTSNEPPGTRPIPPEYWMTVPAIRGTTQPPDTQGAPTDDLRDLLVQSREGRYLVLQLELQSDGYDTPRIDFVRVHYPRRSYTDYLPAVFSADEDSRSFLERFLGLFQTDWDDIEQTAARYARYLDPAAVPDDGGFLGYLADWLALPLEGEWDATRKRRLLAAAARFYPWRGTSDGLTRFLAVYLQNIAGLDQAPAGFPRIIEGFRERQYVLLSDHRSVELAATMPLWGPDVVGRLRLSGEIREGEARLVSTGDPQRDIFHEYAHRFRVFVPSGWVADADDERMLRRAIDLEKPAHAQYQLCLVEPRFRVGIQSVIGVDTVLGDYPVARLGRYDDQDPPSRQPAGRLGYDTVLAEAPSPGPGLRLTAAAHLGIDTSLA